MTEGHHNMRTGSKDLYDDVMERREDLFPQPTVLFQLAAAIGIHDDERESFSKAEEEEFVRRTTDAFDPHDMFDGVLRAKYPDSDNETRLKRLEEHAEYGIHQIHEEVMKTGTFRIEAYV